MIEKPKLREAMMRHFNMSDLHAICFDMDLDNESLTMTDKTIYVIEIIRFCERRNCLPVLLQKCAEMRPQIDFDNPNSRENVRHELGITNRETTPYLRSQFIAYAKVWGSLQALRFVGDEIWDEVNEQTVKKFATESLKVKKLVANGAIYFEEIDYYSLREVLNAIADFQIGKSHLHDLYQRQKSRQPEEIIYESLIIEEAERTLQIQWNGRFKERYESLLERICVSFRERLAAI